MAAMAPDASPEAIALCRRLDSLADQAVDLAMVGNPRNERGQWIMDRKAQVQRERALVALMATVGCQYHEVVDLRDFLTAALKWVEDLRDQLPTAPADRRIVWADIAGGLQALYNIFDPKWQAVDVIDAGAARGGVFQQCTGVW